MPASHKLFDLLGHLSDQQYQVDLSVKRRETPAERKQRLDLATAEARHGRIRGVIILVAVLLGIAILLGVCYSLAVVPHSSPEDKKWATAVLASTVTFGMGYLVGKEKSTK